MAEVIQKLPPLTDQEVREIDEFIEQGLTWVHPAMREALPFHRHSWRIN